MGMSVGEWLKEQRNYYNLTQKELCDALKKSQSCISAWENGFLFPNLKELTELFNYFGVEKEELVCGFEANFKQVNNKKNTTNKGGALVMERMGLYELAKEDSVRTFDGKTYHLKGYLGVETETGEVEKVADLYYRTRSVVRNNKIIAKRKNKDDELGKLNKSNRKRVLVSLK